MLADTPIGRTQQLIMGAFRNSQPSHLVLDCSTKGCCEALKYIFGLTLFSHMTC